MFEDTNQAIEATDTMDEDFSDLFTEEEASAAGEELRDTNGEAAAGQSGADTPMSRPAMEGSLPGDTSPEQFTVRFNGEDRVLSREEMIQNAQKGLNYDHVLQERDALRNDRTFALIDRFAKESGLSRAEYLDQLEGIAAQQKVRAEMQRGVPEETARRLVSMRSATERAQQVRRQAQQQEVAAFVRAYPEVREFPPEVLSRISSGEPVLSAYRAWENEQLRAQLSAAKQNDKNRQTAVGSARGDGAGETPDDFLAGFDGV